MADLPDLERRLAVAEAQVDQLGTVVRILAQRLAKVAEPDKSLAFFMSCDTASDAEAAALDWLRTKFKEID